MMKLLVISLLFSLASTEEGKVTCIAPSTPVEEGKNISITCHFPFDVSQENYMSVDVYQQPNNGDREPVVSCLRLNAETLDCTTEKGYSIEGEVKTSLKLHIMNISPKHNGRFFCQVMPQYGDMPDVEICSLSVHGMSDLSTTAETAVSDNLDGGAGDDESDVRLYFGVGVGVGVGSTSVVGIIIIVCCSWYTKRNRRNKSDVEDSCFSMAQIRVRKRRPQEENSRKSEQMLPKCCKGNINDHVPYSDHAEVNNLMSSMENVQQDDGEEWTPMLPMGNGQQKSEQMLRKRRKGNISVKSEQMLRKRRKGNISVENEQKLCKHCKGKVTEENGKCVHMDPKEKPWLFRYSWMSQWLPVSFRSLESTK